MPEFDPYSIDESKFLPPKTLHNLLHRIALLNPDFSNGITNGIGWRFDQEADADPLEPALPEEMQWPEPYVTTSYAFNADRTFSEFGDSNLEFTYSHIRTEHNLYLPLNIAAYRYPKLADPQYSAGPVDHVHATRVEISDDDFEVFITRSTEFYDSEEELIVKTDDVPQDDRSDEITTTVFTHPTLDNTVTPKPGEPVTINTILDHIPAEFRSDAYLKYDTEDNPISIDALGDSIEDFNKEQRDLALASALYHALKQAARYNGMNI